MESMELAVPVSLDTLAARACGVRPDEMTRHIPEWKPIPAVPGVCVLCGAPDIRYPADPECHLCAWCSHNQEVLR